MRNIGAWSTGERQAAQDISDRQRGWPVHHENDFDICDFLDIAIETAKKREHHIDSLGSRGLLKTQCNNQRNIVIDPDRLTPVLRCVECGGPADVAGETCDECVSDRKNKVLEQKRRKDRLRRKLMTDEERERINQARRKS